MSEQKPTKEEIAAAILSLLEKGRISDSGEQRNGQIVWKAVPDKKH
jgi:hypothetical protein